MWRSSPASPGSAKRGRLARRRREVLVAAPAAPAARHHRLLPLGHQVGEHLAAVEVADHGAARDLDDDVLARGAALVGAATVLGRARP